MKIYLAIPYSWNPESSYRDANEVAAKLMDQGHIVFSPITHSHNLKDYFTPERQFDHDFWLRQDTAFLAWADEVWVVDTGLGNILDSKGVVYEIKYALVHEKPVKRYIQATGEVKPWNEGVYK